MRCLKTHCKRGHRFDAKNIIWIKAGKNKKYYRACRRCKAAYNKSKYHGNLAYRTQMRQKALSRYYLLKSQDVTSPGLSNHEH